MPVVETSDSNFENDVLKASELALVDFFAPWCTPCKQLAPLIEEMSKEFHDVKFFKLNTDENPHIAQTYRISGIPTMILFKAGQPVKSEVGVMSRDKLREFINSAK